MIVQYGKDYRNSYTYCEKYIQDITVIELLREKSHIIPFPGYGKINIDFNLLQSIISQEEPSWKTALSSMKGVYLITDKSNGKLYVGSASGEESFWSRWKNYTDNGHGGNKDLKEIFLINNIDYASQNFQFSILEVTTDEGIILQRESFWKDILLSRQFGYNRN